MIKLNTPLTKKDICALKVGQEVLLSGTLFAFRDKAHKTLCSLKKMPLDLRGQILYYMGPTPTRPRKVCGSCGPTTSARMDKYCGNIIKKTGIIGIIGKGPRCQEANEDMRGKAVYFATFGGIGALSAKCVTSLCAVCFKDYGAEAVFKLQVKDMPLIVAQDFDGNNIYGD